MEKETVKPEHDRIYELHTLLSELMRKDISTKEGLRDWYVEARRVQDTLTSAGGLGPFVPELIWHYLADADIRAKDSAYREQQDAFVRAFVTLLEKGEVPSEESVRAYATDA